MDQSQFHLKCTMISSVIMVAFTTTLVSNFDSFFYVHFAACFYCYAILFSSLIHKSRKFGGEFCLVVI